MTRKPLETKIKLEIVGADIVIDDLDIDIKIKKTNESTPNTCTCEIWNLSESTNEKLRDKTKAVRVLISKGGGDYIQIFYGTLRYLKKRSKSTRPKPKKPRKSKSKKVQHYNKPSFQVETEGADVKTIIELEDGHKEIVYNSHFSRSYEGTTSSSIIINDCIDNLRRNNVPIGIVDTIPEKAYVNGKTYHDNTLSVINSLGRALNCKGSIQNGVFQFVNLNTKGSQFAIVLDGYNCAKPESATDKEVDVECQLLPTTNPNDLVRLNFESLYNGIYRVYTVEHEFNNYGTKEQTKLTLKDK